MRVMVHWTIHPDKRHDVFAGFAAMDLDDYKNQPGPTITTVGRWHDVINGTGVVIFETDDMEALGQVLMLWNGVCDFKMATAMTDEEAHEVCKKHPAGG